MSADEERAAAGPSSWVLAWRLLNSPLLLFVLSAVVLTYLTQRHADLAAANTRKALQMSDRSRLLIELANRSDEISSRVNELVEFAEARSDHPIRVHCNDAADGARREAESAMTNTKRPAEIEATRQLHAAISGVPPYVATSPTYTNVHTILLLSELDENFGNPLSRKQVTWSVPRSSAQLMQPIVYTVRGMPSDSICGLIRAADSLALYYEIRTVGSCIYEQGSDAISCRLDPPKVAGYE
jgi:hypothetical protein